MGWAAELLELSILAHVLTASIKTTHYLLTVNISAIRALSVLLLSLLLITQRKTHINANPRDTFTLNDKTKGKRKSVFTKHTHTLATTFVRTLFAEWEFFPGTSSHSLWRWTWPSMGFNTWHEDYKWRGLHSIHFALTGFLWHLSYRLLSQFV